MIVGADDTRAVTLAMGSSLMDKENAELEFYMIGPLNAPETTEKLLFKSTQLFFEMYGLRALKMKVPPEDLWLIRALDSLGFKKKSQMTYEPQGPHLAGNYYEYIITAFEMKGLSSRFE